MNNPLDPTLRELNACGCCAGTGAQTPVAIDNRAGLPAIRFRAGVHSQFKATLLAALSSSDWPALRALRTREDDDFTIALLDAFASAADVLTFYSERIANEAFLRSATERRSVLEMARAIGYELAPGVAAKVMLSFTIEGGPGAPGIAVIPKGTRVQSIPGPGEKPQTFETSAELTARAPWNELRPRLREAPPAFGDLPDLDELYLSGTATNLRLGDVLVLSSGPIGAPPATVAVAKRVAEVKVDREKDHTFVKFEGSASTTVAPLSAPPAPPAVAASAVAASTASIGAEFNSTNVGSLFRSGVSSKTVFEQNYFFGWELDKLQNHLNSLPRVSIPEPDKGVFALRARADFFGHNAPKWESLPKTDTALRDAYPEDWDDLNAHLVPKVSPPKPTRIWQDSQGTNLNPDATQFDVLIERAMPEVLAGSWLVLETENATLVPLRVGRNSELSRADYAMSAKCARLNLKGADGTSNPAKEDSFTTRGTAAHLQSEPLTLLGAPIAADLTPGQIDLPLDRIDAHLAIGQALALKGEDADLPGTTQREIIVIDAITHSDVTTLRLREGLKHKYVRATVTLNANVIAATHGETTDEVLGSGDAARPFQRFELKQAPLTYTFPTGGSALESSLEIRVDGVRWSEAPFFFGHGPKERVYVVRRADDGTATVQFGDGRYGARLPTGRENVRAVYRKGIGLEGIVKEEQIGLLLTQPLGVKRVSNLLPPEGAENPQSLDDARANAPLTVLTLDRIVSLQDYEDFARSFPGVEKAHAAWTWSGQTRGVLLTLLGPGGSIVNATGQPADPLLAALVAQGNGRVPVRIVSRPPSLFVVSGTVRVEADRLPSAVEAAVYAALRAAFSFAAREFGQGVHLSEVIAVIQNVAGVAFVDVSGLSKTALVEGAPVVSEADRGYLAAHKPANGVGAQLAAPAELLILNERSLSQLEVRAL